MVTNYDRVRNVRTQMKYFVSSLISGQTTEYILPALSPDWLYGACIWQKSITIWWIEKTKQRKKKKKKNFAALRQFFFLSFFHVKQQHIAKGMHEGTLTTYAFRQKRRSFETKHSFLQNWIRDFFLRFKLEASVQRTERRNGKNTAR